METMLTKMVAADSGDSSFRSKLRLLKICRCANTDGFLWQLGVLIITASVVDKLLYLILGDGSEGSRLTLKRLLHEASSPISDLQQRFLCGLRNFSEDAEFWLLFRELGGDFGSRACRSFARRHQLQTSAALLQYFEARMSHGHYMLIKLTDDGVPAGQKLQIAEAFHDIPVHRVFLY